MLQERGALHHHSQPQTQDTELRQTQTQPQYMRGEGEGTSGGWTDKNTPNDISHHVYKFHVHARLIELWSSNISVVFCLQRLDNTHQTREGWVLMLTTPQSNNTHSSGVGIYDIPFWECVPGLTPGFIVGVFYIPAWPVTWWEVVLGRGLPLEGFARTK